MFIARFKSSRMPVARRKTEHAAWRAAEAHGVPMSNIEVVTEAQHQSDRYDLPELPTHYNWSPRTA